jgi:hypothetical protein
MKGGRSSSVGETRACPHCRATILKSHNSCPGCGHHLRIDSVNGARRASPTFSPLRVEGTIRHPAAGESWEYSLVLTIENDRGEEISRQVVGVGALHPNDLRTFKLAVEIFAPKTSAVTSADFK